MPDPGAMAAVRCPLCASAGVAFGQPHPDFKDTGIHACAACDFRFAEPAPADAELAAYYRTTYGARRTWGASPEYLTLMQRRAAAQRAFLQPELAHVRTALDLGCGVGALVAELARAGVDAVGYDSDESVIRTGRARWGANIHPGHVTGSDATGKFDLLCLSHVVEHLPRPVRDLGELAGRIRPGGWMFVEVPRCIPWMFAARVPTESHLGFHSAQSLAVLAASAGLEVVRMGGYGPPIVDYYLARGERERWGWPARLLAGLARRASRLAPSIWPVRTEFDGWFDALQPPGAEPVLWLRALLRRPARPA